MQYPEDTLHCMPSESRMWPVDLLTDASNVRSDFYRGLHHYILPCAIVIEILSSCTAFMPVYTARLTFVLVIPSLVTKSMRLQAHGPCFMKAPACSLSYFLYVFSPSVVNHQCVGVHPQ